MHIIYTGGTTGFPKGVMWRHEDFWRVLGGGIDFYTGVPLEEFDQSKQAADPRMVTFPLSPLMHGGAQAACSCTCSPGTCTILEPKFDPVRTWEIIEREKVQLIFMTGDAMARPLIEAFERKAGDRDAVRRLEPVRDLQQRRDLQPAGQGALDGGVPERRLHRLRRRDRDRLPGHGHAGQANNISTDGPVDRPRPRAASSSTRTTGSSTSRPTSAGSGRLGRGGSVPVGYYKDPEKSAATFLVIDGERYSVPGDFARIEEDDKVTLLGRGSNCVNTGGEKVYPEEVEMAVKGHPAVYDVPRRRHPRREVRPGRRGRRPARGRAQTLELEELREFLRTTCPATSCRAR